MPIATYDAKQIVVTVAGQTIVGYADGDFCSVEYNEDHVTMVVGANGDGARALVRNYSGKITLTLLATSPSNNLLMDLYLADRVNGGGVTNILVQDNNGVDKHAAATAWVVKPPTAGYGREVGTREWVLETNELITYVGGYVPATPAFVPPPAP